MKKSTAVFATIAIAGTLATGSVLLPEKTPEEISIIEQIIELQIVLEEKQANGEGTTVTVQKINELKAQLKF